MNQKIDYKSQFSGTLDWNVYIFFDDLSHFTQSCHVQEKEHAWTSMIM